MTWWIDRPRLRLVWWAVVLPVLIAAYTAAGLVPATWWYQPISLAISDAAAGENPTVSINRQIKRSFFGSYTAPVIVNIVSNAVILVGVYFSLRSRWLLIPFHERAYWPWWRSWQHPSFLGFGRRKGR